LWGATPISSNQKPADAGASCWPEPESQNEANARGRMSTKKVRGDDYDDRMTTTTMTGLMAR
jgi:hypothetical protein